MIKKISLIFALLFIYTGTLSYASPPDILERYINSDDAQLFCRALGKGEPLIVLHGGPGLTQDYLLPQLYKLAENNFVIFYDQRGCGLSTGEINLNAVTIQTFVNDLDNLRRAFNFEKVSILGHSWGGFLAMEYAIAHPENIEKLILSNSMPGSSEGLMLFGNEWLRRMTPYQEEIAAIHNAPGFEEGDPELTESLHRIIFRTYCFNPEKADLLNLCISSTAAVNGAKVYNMLRQNVFERPFNLHELLERLTIPTLIIHGDVDPIPPSTAQETHEKIAGSQYILMKNCGHFPYVEEPDAFFKHIKCFLMERNHVYEKHGFIEITKKDMPSYCQPMDCDEKFYRLEIERDLEAPSVRDKL